MRARKAHQTTGAEYALAIGAYRNEQEQIKHLLQNTLGHYGKPKTSLKGLRKRLATELGDFSLSQLIIKMREEGF